MGVAKGVFLFNRYFVEGALLYNVYSEFGGFSKHISNLIPASQYCWTCTVNCPRR